MFIIDPFEGKGFEHVASGKFKCAVIGPRCLLMSLSMGQSVPDLPYPMYNAAMRGKPANF